jgi:selenocysteine-specific elongation factor
MALLVEQPLSPPDLPQLETTLGLGRARLLEIVRVLERNRSIVRVATDLYVAAAGIERLKSGMAEHFLTSATITPAEFRDRFGTSRKYAIPLLEYCDREGLTVRQGDVRRPGRASSVPTGRI